MVRINLLPAEILERRKYERWYPAVIIPGVIMLLVVVAVWGVLSYIASTRSQELQTIEERTRSLQAQADSYSIFEEQEDALKQREQVATAAVAGRINMGGLAEELSVVLPEEIFLRILNASETEGLLLDGCAPRGGGASMASSFKSTAAALVRLNALDSLYDVWLTSAEIGDFTTFQGLEGDSEADVEVINFTATAKIAVPSSSAATPTASAPAATP